VTGVSKDVVSLAARRLADAGCVAPDREAAALANAARGDLAALASFVERRTTGEPLAWIIGWTDFCGRVLLVDPGVYVPRWQSEPIAERAAALLPPDGRAIDLGTGSGAIARVLLDRRPASTVIGIELDPIAARCARRNGIDVVEGDLFSSVPASWAGTVDVIVGVLPYVPTDEIAFLPRDVRHFEPRVALDGGVDGLAVLRRTIVAARTWLRPAGHVVFEVGGDQPAMLTDALLAADFHDVRVFAGADGEPRGVEALRG
jgi:release factor glutamine methyltransferase